MTSKTQGPDLTRGVNAGKIKEGRPFRGHVDGDPVVVVRQNDRFFAISAECTHYGGPLEEGLVTPGAIRCPWHHACFDLETGRADGPAVEPVTCYQVECEDDILRVTGERESETPETAAGATAGPIVIIGGGAAGEACAERLRRGGFEGSITLVGDAEPYTVDRPNLSKDFLAGEAPEDWLPVRGPDFFEEHNITWTQDRAVRVERARREVVLESGERLSYQMLLLATGSRARSLPIPGADKPHVHTLRSLADARSLKEGASEGERAVIIGAGFIGLEVAASLLEHDVKVTVVAPESEPLGRLLGEKVGAVLRESYADHGVEFCLEQKPSAIHDDHVELDDGTTLPADLVVLGVGAEPRLELAEEAGLEIEDGVVVDARLRTSDPAIFAAGDIARFPWDGDSARIEHWAVAQRQGQCVAENMLGEPSDYDAVPFFWSRHPEVNIQVVGHAPEWDEALIVGDLEDFDATISYWDEGRIKSIATLGRPQVSMRAESLFAINDQEGLQLLARGRVTPSHAEPAPPSMG